ncbi:MAG: anti-sigma factor family protein, partial [Cellulosilyticaceae bacterium]
MKCLDSGTLQAYMDGELSPQMMAHVMKHLDQCEACQRQFKAILAMNEWEETLKEEENPSLMIDMQAAWDKVEKKTTQKNIISKLKGVFSEMKN